MKFLQESYDVIKAIDEQRDENEFCDIDVLKLMNALMPHEVDIPDELVTDEFGNGTIEYLYDLTGLEDWTIADNSYNWNGNISHHIDYRCYDDVNGYFVCIQFHKRGDVRGNYTRMSLLQFRDAESFYEVLTEQYNFYVIELGDFEYVLYPSIGTEEIEVICNNIWSFSVYGDYMDDIIKEIREKENNDGILTSIRRY